MADFRRKEYRGSLLLVQECGPVDVVVDTDAKTVTPSLAKADTGYSVAGGGGGLEYVIPEQTFNSIPVDGVTLQLDSPLPEASIIIKGQLGGGMPTTGYYISQYFENTWTPSQAEGFTIVLNNGTYTLQYSEDDEPTAMNIEITISAIAAF